MVSTLYAQGFHIAITLSSAYSQQPLLPINRSIYAEPGDERHVTATPIQDRAITHSALSDGSNQPWEISSKERGEKPVFVE
jgi:hypothetical protein